MVPDRPLGDIAAHLDDLAPHARRAFVMRLDRAAQRDLYGKADPEIDLDWLVGDGAPLTEVVYDGRNTLPVLPPFRRFQKRFCRPDGGPDRLYGYNEGASRRLLGPGYFVAVPADGGVLIDYDRVPEGPVAPGWPRVVPNSQGLQRFVFRGTRDILRRVSTHVCIGAAYRGDRALDHYFVLCRR